MPLAGSHHECTNANWCSINWCRWDEEVVHCIAYVERVVRICSSKLKVIKSPLTKWCWNFTFDNDRATEIIPTAGCYPPLFEPSAPEALKPLTTKLLALLPQRKPDHPDLLRRSASMCRHETVSRTDRRNRNINRLSLSENAKSAKSRLQRQRFWF